MFKYNEEYIFLSICFEFFNDKQYELRVICQKPSDYNIYLSSSDINIAIHKNGKKNTE